MTGRAFVARLRCWLPAPSKSHRLREYERREGANTELRTWLCRLVGEARTERDDARRAHAATLDELDRLQSLVREVVDAWNDCRASELTTGEVIIYTGHTGLADTLNQLEPAVGA